MEQVTLVHQDPVHDCIFLVLQACSLFWNQSRLKVRMYMYVA